MRRRTFDRLLNLARAALLGLSGLAIAIVWVWQYQPEQVEWLENELLESTLDPYLDREAEAREAERQDRQRSIELYLELLDDLDFVRQRDRLAGVKQKALLHLTRMSRAAGDLDAAVAWNRRWIEFEGRSVRPRLLLGELLCQRPETRADGIAALRALLDLVPNDAGTAAALAGGLMAAGRYAEAMAVFDEDPATTPSRGWRVYWDGGAGFGPLHRGKVVPRKIGDRLELRFSIHESPVRGIRICPPPFAAIELIDPVLTVRIPGGPGPITLRYAEMPVEAMGFHHDGARFRSVGGLAPSLSLSVDRAGAEAEYDFVFRAGIARVLPDGLLAATLLPQAQGVEAELRAAGSAGEAARFRRLRLEAVSRRQVAAYWRAVDQQYSQSRNRERALSGRVQDGALAFDVTLPIGEAASFLRIDPPEGIGIRYRFRPLEVQAGGVTTTIDPGTVELRNPHAIEREDGAFVVTAVDPYFAITLPDLGVPIDSVRVAGTCR